MFCPQSDEQSPPGVQRGTYVHGSSVQPPPLYPEHFSTFALLLEIGRRFTGHALIKHWTSGTTGASGTHLLRRQNTHKFDTGRSAQVWNIGVLRQLHKRRRFYHSKLRQVGSRRKLQKHPLFSAPLLYAPADGR